MNSIEKNTKIIKYETKGTCCKIMHIEIANNVIQNTVFIGGCPGNLMGIQNLVKGMNVDDVISKFKGVTCGDKPTSCPDQLAQCLMQYKNPIL